MELDELAVKVNLLHQIVGDIKYSREIELAYYSISYVLDNIRYELSSKGLEYVITELPKVSEDNQRNIEAAIYRTNDLLKLDTKYVVNFKELGEQLFKELNKQ